MIALPKTSVGSGGAAKGNPAGLNSSEHECLDAPSADGYFRSEISLALAARYAHEDVPLCLWPRDTLPTIAPPPPSKPVWTTHEAWLSELPRLRGCFSEGDLEVSDG